MKILEEDSVAGDGGSFGDTQPTATFQSGDNYATGDSRNIFGGFPVKVQKRSGITYKKRRKKKKSKKKSRS